MRSNYVVVLQSVKAGRAERRVELGEFCRIKNAQIFLDAKAKDMWGMDWKMSEAKSPTVGYVYYNDSDMVFRIELFIQLRLIEGKDYRKSRDPQT